MDKTINVFLTSKNRSQNLEHPSNWNVKFPSNLISCDQNKEGLKINVVSFHIQNNFYNVFDDNDEFRIIIDIDINENINRQEYVFYIEHGNYSVNTFRDYINSMVSLYMNITYNSSRNKYKFKRTYELTNDNITVYFQPINCGSFFGCENGIMFLLQSLEYEAPFTCSMISFDKIVVNAYGLNFEYQSIENIGLNDPIFEKSSILLWTSRTDVGTNQIIKYENQDGGNSYCYNLYDNYVENINLILTDEYGRELTDALDYTMMLQFIIYQKNNNKMIDLLEKMTEYLKNIYIYMMIILEYIGVLKK